MILSEYNISTLWTVLLILVSSCNSYQKTDNTPVDKTRTTSSGFVINESGDTVLTGVYLNTSFNWKEPAKSDPPGVRELGQPEIVRLPARKQKGGAPRVKILEEPILRKVSAPVSFSIEMNKKPMSLSEPIPAQPMQFKDAALTNIKYLDIEQGLSSSYVYSVIQDSRGNIWFGTQNGAVRYDGVSFVNIGAKEGLTHPVVTSVFEDKQGNIWFGSLNGDLTKYDGLYFYQVNAQRVLRHNTVWVVNQDLSGAIWVGTNEGIMKLTDQSDETYRVSYYGEEQGISSGLVYSIFECNNGYLWVGSEGGVSKIEQDENGPVSTVNFSTGNELPRGIVRNLAQDSGDNIWVAMLSGGLHKLVLEEKNWKVYSYSKAEGLLSDDVIEVYEDTKGLIYVGYDEFGMSVLSNFSQDDILELEHITEDKGLSKNIVISIIEDDSGNIWAATIGGGVSQLGPQTFAHFTQKVGLSNSVVLSIERDKEDNLWFGTSGGGVTRYNSQSGNNEFAVYSTKEGIADLDVRSILQDSKGDIWLGTDYGLNRIKPDGQILRYCEKQGMAGMIIRDIMEDHNGDLWFATEGGVSKYLLSQEGTSINTGFYSIPDELMISQSIRTVIEDNSGQIWIASNAGVSKLSENSIYHYTEAQGLPSRFTRTVMEDDLGDIWVGSYGGLSRIEAGDSIVTETFTMLDGLSNNTIWSLYETPDHSIWAGTERGLNRVNHNNGATVEILQFGKEDGLKGLDFYNNSVEMDDQGRLWWGTGKALTVQDPSIERKLKSTPRIQLTNIKLDREFVNYEDWVYKTPVEVNGKDYSQIRFSKEFKPFYHYPETINLPFTIDHIDFFFSAIEWSAHERVRYQYRLQGLEDNWSTLGDWNSASYSNLKEGDYTFKVRALSASGQWSDTLSYPFQVQPPWWRTSWGQSLFVLMAIVAFVLFSRWRTARLEQSRIKLLKTIDDRTSELKSKNDELKRINDELYEFTYVVSHDLKSPLRGISSLTTWIYEDNINSLESKSIDHLRLLIKKVDQMEDFIDGLLKYHRMGRKGQDETTLSVDGLVKEVVELLAVPSQIHIDIENELPTLKISKIHMLQIFQNLLSNAINYNDKDETLIKVGCELNDQVKFYVKDNGPGIDKAHHKRIFQIFQTLSSKKDNSSTGIGLSIVKKIVNIYDGDIWVESEVGEGSIFYFTLDRKYLVKPTEEMAV